MIFSPSSPHLYAEECGGSKNEALKLFYYLGQKLRIEPYNVRFWINERVSKIVTNFDFQSRVSTGCPINFRSGFSKKISKCQKRRKIRESVVVQFSIQFDVNFLDNFVQNLLGHSW